MNKKIYSLAILALFLVGTFTIISAHSDEDFSQAEQIIQQNISCDNLSQDQLEILGDYYMEQIHPGEQHEYMDAMMGGEGSESLRQMHINMGVSFYCNGNEIPQTSGYETMGMMYSGGNYYSYHQSPISPFLSFLIAALIVVTIIIVVKGRK